MNASFQIPPEKKLIIVDAHDTVLRRDLSRSPKNIFGDPRETESIVWSIRDGLLNFLEYYHGILKKRIVISSDGSPARLAAVFKKFGLEHSIEKIYGREHLHRESYLKQLDLIVADAGLQTEDAIFIGDSRIDRLSAERYGVDFVQVPGTLEEPHFSFNSFLHLDFADEHSGIYGLALQKITNIKRAFRNLSTPELVERIVDSGEGRLIHLGPVACETGEHTDYLASARYIVREPSSESRVYWGEEYQPFDPERFQQLYLRMLAFLQDRELYIQDCFAGANPASAVPLRIITQTAAHSLFARNTFIQATPEQLASFFPEFTVIHLPHFRSLPEIDGTSPDEANGAFVVLHLARKLVLIGGTAYSGEIRRSAFLLLSDEYIQKDILPVRCSSNRPHSGSGRPALFLGETSVEKGALTFDSERFFFGDAYHGWAASGFFNLEWGTYPPVRAITRKTSPAIFDCTRRFGTLIENVFIDEHRRPRFADARTAANARASFPITHLDRVDRKGVAGAPADLFLVLHDGTGSLPPLARLTPEQLVVYLLLGYAAPRPSGDIFPPLSFEAFYRGYPLLFHPAVYALRFWEKLKRSEARCWLINVATARELPENALLHLVAAVHADGITDNNLTHDSLWNFERIVGLSGFPADFFDPSYCSGGDRAAPGDASADRAAEWNARLIAAFHERFESYRPLLKAELSAALPPGNVA